MKATLYISIIALFAACNNAPKADKAETTEKQVAAEAKGTVYNILPSNQIRWTGTKPTGSHTGTINVTDGSISYDGTKVTGGNFTIDIKSLVNEDLANDAESKAKLEGHLKSPDFFDAEKFPTARFEITSVENSSGGESNIKDANYKLSGNLTLRDSTKNISFPARITMNGDTLQALADFNIDRSQWGVSYKGPNNPQDWIISKQVNLKIDMKAVKQ